MSDLSEPKTTAPFSPTPYSVWATENPFENELEGRTKHLDNLRLEYIAAGKYNEDTEKKFQESFENVLIKKGCEHVEEWNYVVFPAGPTGLVLLNSIYLRLEKNKFPFNF